MLSVQNLSVAYGGIEAVKSMSLHVNPGELVTLIGSNGAGKTTTMKALAGLLPMHAGDVLWHGKSIRGLGAWDLVAQGLVMVPEGRGIFTRMTILENLLMGAYVLQGASTRVQTEEGLARAYTLFPRLKERAHQLAGTLSGGEQQMLAIARSLMSKPQMLLLDEPSMGLSPLMVEKIFEIIQTLRTQGMTVLLVEQNAQQALQIADRAYVMESGVVTMSEDAQVLLHDPRVRLAYLGESGV